MPSRVTSPRGVQCNVISNRDKHGTYGASIDTTTCTCPLAMASTIDSRANLNRGHPSLGRHGKLNSFNY